MLGQAKLVLSSKNVKQKQKKIKDEIVDAESLERSLGCVSDSNNTVTCKTSHYLQIDMSKCMVSFIDWYLLRINASEREKIKVRLSPAPVEPNYFQITQNIKCIQIS